MHRNMKKSERGSISGVIGTKFSILIRYNIFNDKLLRFYLKTNTEEVNFKYFVTFTFVGEYKEATLEAKLKLFKAFIKKLKRKKDFEYFWVSENDTTFLHVHMLCDWDYSYGYVEDEWYKYQKCEKTDSWATKIEALEKGETAYINRVSFMFKEDRVHYGISRTIKIKYYKWVKWICVFDDEGM
jgi:hypothetical protein